MEGMVSLLLLLLLCCCTGEPLLLFALLTRLCFLTIFFIFLTLPFFTVDADDAAPLMGGRLVDVLAAAPPRVVNSVFLLLLLCTTDDEEERVEPPGVKFQGLSRRKIPRPPLEGEEDCVALMPVIEMAATRQTPSAVAV